MIIGLVSVLMGSTDMQDIEAFCAAAIVRGTKIMDGVLEEVGEKSPEKQGYGDGKSR
jgi:hypothetical protein